MDMFTRGSLALGAAVLAITSARADATALGSYDVKLDETSVSGISSGAYMAVQLAVARSSLVVGVGAIAGGPYYCAQDSVSTALADCMIGPPPAAGSSKAIADRWAAAGRIDDTANIARQKVWLFHGYNDGVVKKPVADALHELYRSYAAAAKKGSGNVHYQDDVKAAHAHVTDSFGQACERTGGEFINRCASYDAAGVLLQFIHGALKDRNRTGRLSGAILAFEQSAFHRDIRSVGMDEVGYVYVPASCAAQGPCRVHVAFHGCLQNARTIGPDYHEHGGYNEWADTNGIIVLYPQTIASKRYYNPFSSIPYNPNGCWDWWGYTGKDYAQKDGAQIAVIEKMLRTLARNYSGWKAPASAAPLSLRAIDSSSSSVALAWTAIDGVERYTLERASGPGCSGFARIEGAIVQGNSFSDSGLAPETKYCYRLGAVRRGGETVESAVVERTTTRDRPACDPYVRSVHQHWREDRTHLRWLKTYANGSNEYVGDVGPGSVFEQVLLKQTSPGHFVVGRPCE